MNGRASRPMSPCVNICTLDDEHVCMGCLRRLEEIIAWATMSGEEQWGLVEDLQCRSPKHTPAGRCCDILVV